jgi:DNA helicase-2/ATP-dependent DNA helicase PcrA
LVTIHRAKGLEWEVIAIPAVTKGNFPGRSQMFPDPHSKASVLPIQYRIDERYRDLPSDDKSRRSYLRAENEIQEWRVAYVGATRAKSHLIVTGAYWYGHPETNIEPKAPSELFELVRSHPISTDAGFASLSARPEILRHDGEVEAPDPVFEKGWRDFLATEIEQSGNARAIADELGVGDAHDAEVSHWEQRLFELSSIPSVNEDDDELTVSVTGLVTYAGCPKQYYWSEVDRLPRRRNPAAVAGTEIHRRIELHQKGAVPLDVIADQIHGTPGSVADRGPSDPRPDAFETFLGSRFGAREASLIESPFKMSIEPGFSVRGRIDAIYSDDQGVEIVDFKSGRPSADPARLVQLQAYAVAVDRVDFGLEHHEPMRVTFAYLGDGLAEESHRVDEDWLETAHETISGIRRGIKAEEFQATPSERCHSCDFLQFCEPGRAYTSS